MVLHAVNSLPISTMSCAARRPRWRICKALLFKNASRSVPVTVLSLVMIRLHRGLDTRRVPAANGIGAFSRLQARNIVAALRFWGKWSRPELVSVCRDVAYGVVRDGTVRRLASGCPLARPHKIYH